VTVHSDSNNSPRVVGYQKTSRNPECHGQSGSIWTINADGTGEKKVIEDNSTVLEPSWAPDGTSIIFASEREHKSAIFRVNLDGTGLGRLRQIKSLLSFFLSFHQMASNW
jgi:Tol biopolymer transport system component